MGGQAPTKKSPLPWIITAVVAVAAAVLIVVLNKNSDVNNRKDAAGTSQSQEQSQDNGSGTSDSGSSDEGSAGNSDSAASSAGQSGSGALDLSAMESDAQSFVDYLTAGDLRGARIYVCSADKSDYDSAVSEGSLDNFKNLTMTVTGSEATGDTLAIAHVDVQINGSTQTVDFPMSSIKDLWWFCPSDQPDVKYNG